MALCGLHQRLPWRRVDVMSEKGWVVVDGRMDGQRIHFNAYHHLKGRLELTTVNRLVLYLRISQTITKHITKRRT